MSRPAALLASLSLLAACGGGDPFGDVERLSEVETAAETGRQTVAASGPQDPDAPISENYDGQGGAAVPAAAPSPGGGLLGRLFGGGGVAPPEDGPASRQVAPGTQLPFGTVATVCGVTPGMRGQQVAEQSGYGIWDSQPGERAPHTFYITGMADGCDRQFTAALALAGDVSTHELVRYSSPEGYSRSDSVYEAIKAKVCRVAHGTPCGEKVDVLDGQTAFVTAYPRFGSSDRWAEILVHNGAVHAVSREGF